MKRTLTRSFGAVVLALIVTIAGHQPAQAEPGNHTTEANLAADYIGNNVSQLIGLPASSLGQALDGYTALNAVKFNGGSLTGDASSGLGALENDIYSADDDGRTKLDRYCMPTTSTSNVGACAKAAIALMSAGNGSSQAASNYLSKILMASNYNQYATNHALAIIALARAKQDVPEALYSVALSWASGGGPSSDPDTAGLMLTALSYVNDNSTSKSDAIANLHASVAQYKVSDGPGWDNSKPPVEGDVNTTAWVAPGVHRTGTATQKPIAEDAQAVFIDNQDDDGKIGPNLMSTIQAVPPLLGLRSYDNAGAGNPAGSVGVLSATGVRMSVFGVDTTRNTATTPFLVLNNVATGTVTAQVLGTADLIEGEDGFTYCLPGMDGTFTPVPGVAAVAGTVTNNTATYSGDARLTEAGCYKWQVTLTIGTATHTQITEPFAVRS